MVRWERGRWDQSDFTLNEFLAHLSEQRVPPALASILALINCEPSNQLNESTIYSGKPLGNSGTLAIAPTCWISTKRCQCTSTSLGYSIADDCQRCYFGWYYQERPSMPRCIVVRSYPNEKHNKSVATANQPIEREEYECSNTRQSLPLACPTSIAAPALTTKYDN